MTTSQTSGTEPLPGDPDWTWEGERARVDRTFPHWTEDERASFVNSVEDYHKALLLLKEQAFGEQA